MPDKSFFSLLLDASPVAQLVLLLLLVLLYLAVWKILHKRIGLRGYETDCNLFEEDFWHGGDLDVLEKRARDGEYGAQGLSRVFLEGQEEFKKACETGGENVDLILEGVRRAMDAAIQRENVFLGRHMQFLATVAGVSPYIGLLGTVWGIINAFQALTQTSNATIALVAPGIAESLVATAMGLLAAIPALVAYNYFSYRLEQMDARFENFANQYLNILHRTL
ncbi:MAG: MotA/TolQ/ExbB proton channel family protein [Gammaproteobacteria bacterium]